MNTKVNYSTFKDIIQDVRIDISDEQYLTLSPTERRIVKGDEEIVEKLIKIQFVDEQISYDECVEINRKESVDLIRVLQQLNIQIKD